MIQFSPKANPILFAISLLALYQFTWTPLSLESKMTGIRKSDISHNSMFKNSSFTSTKSTVICGREIKYNVASFSSTIQSNHMKKYKVVVIGYDNMHHVQTNNHLNAIFHAMDYAKDNNSTLVITRNGWATNVLENLFGNNNFTENRLVWERDLESNLDLKILDQDVIDKMLIDPTSEYKSVAFMTGDEMYYYHSKSDISVIAKRRNTVLQFLWTHISKITSTVKGKNDMCSSISKSLPEKYVVIHSRWMKQNGCLRRLGRLAKRIKNETSIQIDPKAPCILEPSFIENILLSSGYLDAPIYVISDGKNPNIVQALEKRPKLNVMRVPSEQSWVGGKLFLSVL